MTKGILGGIAAIVLLALMFGQTDGTGRPPPTRSEEIADGCLREFAGDADAVFRCRAELTGQEFEKIQREKLERAAR